MLTVLPPGQIRKPQAATAPTETKTIKEHDNIQNKNVSSPKMSSKTDLNSTGKIEDKAGITSLKTSGYFTQYIGKKNTKLEIFPCSKIEPYLLKILPLSTEEALEETSDGYKPIQLNFFFKNEYRLYGEAQKDAYIFNAVACIIHYLKFKQLITNQTTLINIQDVELAYYKNMPLEYKPHLFGEIKDSKERFEPPKLMGRIKELELETIGFTLTLECPNTTDFISQLKLALKDLGLSPKETPKLGLL